jgi:hypothetical protein
MGKEGKNGSETKAEWEARAKPYDRERKEQFDSISFRPHPTVVTHDEMEEFSPKEGAWVSRGVPFYSCYSPELVSWKALDDASVRGVWNTRRYE